MVWVVQSSADLGSVLAELGKGVLTRTWATSVEGDCMVDHGGMNVVLDTSRSVAATSTFGYEAIDVHVLDSLPQSDLPHRIGKPTNSLSTLQTR